MAIVLGCVAAAPVAVADELYESLDDLTLGRIFLSQAERERLEARRGIVVDAASTGDASDEQAPEPDQSPARPAAGYILARGGRALVWSDGAFRRVTGHVDDVDFPGAGRIRIERASDRGSPAAARGRAMDDEPAADGADEPDVVDPP